MKEKLQTTGLRAIDNRPYDSAVGADMIRPLAEGAAKNPLRYLFCHHHDAAVFIVFLAGGQGDELVTVAHIHAGIVQFQQVDAGHEGIELAFGFEIREFMVLEIIGIYGFYTENCNNFVGLAAMEGIEADVLMAFVETLIFIFQQIRKHRAVVHAVSVDHHII